MYRKICSENAGDVLMQLALSTTELSQQRLHPTRSIKPGSTRRIPTNSWPENIPPPATSRPPHATSYLSLRYFPRRTRAYIISRLRELATQAVMHWHCVPFLLARH